MSPFDLISQSCHKEEEMHRQPCLRWTPGSPEMENSTLNASLQFFFSNVDVAQSNLHFLELAPFRNFILHEDYMQYLLN